MARNKNALRQHWVAAMPAKDAEPDYKRLAAWITDISDDTAEEVEETAFYDGDGTPTSDVVSVAMSYSFSGYYDSSDAAQALIAGLRLATGEGRKIMHKVIESDGAKEFIGTATVTDIVAGSGAAEDYEEFSCTIKYDEIPAYDTVATTTTQA